jgi:hypothetical protein
VLRNHVHCKIILRIRQKSFQCIVLEKELCDNFSLKRQLLQKTIKIFLLRSLICWNIITRTAGFPQDTLVIELCFSKPCNEATGDYNSDSYRGPAYKQRPGLRCIHLTCGLHAVFSMQCGEPQDISRFFAYCQRTALYHLNVLIIVTLSCNTNVGKCTVTLQRRETPVNCTCGPENVAAA